jgi:hypothetical protein
VIASCDHPQNEALRNMPNSSHLEIEKDLDFQYRSWRFQRIGWIIMALIICAGLAGFFGHHPFTKKTEETANKILSVEYTPYTRYESQDNLRVRLTSDTPNLNIIRLWFDEAYLDSLTVVAVSPLPIRGESRKGQRAFVFQSDGRPFTATFSVHLHKLGVVQGSIGIDTGEVLPITHFVWP